MALSRWQRTIVNETGDIQPFAQITVLNEETQGNAAIYADRDGNSPLAGGVATADASGFVYFYAAGGRYRIQSAGLQIDWRDESLGTAATRDVTTSQTDTTTNRLLKVSDFGIGGYNPRDNNLNADDLLGGQRQSWSESFTEQDAVAVNLPALGGNLTSPRSWHVETIGTDSRLVMTATEAYGIGTTRGRTFIRVKHDATWHPWSEITQASNLQQATGQSTQYPMSQKAVTDALIGVGQTWQDVTASRVSDTVYTNTTGRTIFVMCSLDTGAGASFSVGGIVVPLQEVNGEIPVTFSFLVPNGVTYKTTNTGAGKWLELR